MSHKKRLVVLIDKEDYAKLLDKSSKIGIRASTLARMILKKWLSENQ